MLNTRSLKNTLIKPDKVDEWEFSEIRLILYCTMYVKWQLVNIIDFNYY